MEGTFYPTGKLFKTIIGVMVFALLLLYALPLFGNIVLNFDPLLNQNGHTLSDDTIIFSLTSPRVTEDQMVRYFQQNAGNRLKDKGDEFYRYGLKYDIDPAFAAGVSRQESGLSGDPGASTLVNCNNFFGLTYNALSFWKETDGPCAGRASFARFGSVDEGIEAFFVYIREKYIERNPPQDTISKVACSPDSDFRTHCYCSVDGSYCPEWVAAIPRLTGEIRNYGLA